MRKIASILLLGILFFNWFGYRLLVFCLENKADKQLEVQLDNNDYNESQLISIKIPATYLSYYNNSKNYERVNGKIEMGGIQYNYVKRRLYLDSVELLCIPNFTAMRLRMAKDDFFKWVNDLSYNAQSKKSGSHDVFKNFSVDYYTVNDLIRLNSLFFTTIKRSFHFWVADYFHFLSVAEDPPEYSHAYQL